MTDYLTQAAIDAAEGGWVPDSLIRLGIRRLCAQRLATERANYHRLEPGTTECLVADMSQGPIAVATAEANQQHYEEETELFVRVLGPHLKYSCCYWPEGVSTLAEAEDRALAETCRRGQIANGMDILELGCGWGSLALWIAARYPDSDVTAVSNSATQRAYIEGVARTRGLDNLRVMTVDMNEFEPAERYDRVVSVEIFEHMSNYEELLRRISTWLWPDGRLFIHVFAHRHYAYKYESEGPTNWMAQNFFTGGVMPSKDLLTRFQQDVELVDQWWWDGEHYSKTAEAWLENMSRNRTEVLTALGRGHGSAHARIWYQRWRMFFLACAELWGYRYGQEWGVGHYLFEPRHRKRKPISLLSVAC